MRGLPGETIVRLALFAIAIQVAGCPVTTASLNYSDGGSSDAGIIAASSVLEYHRRPSRDGLYTDPALTQAAAGGLHLDAAFNVHIQGRANAQPLYLAAPDGRDRLIVATEENNVYVLDAATGATIVQRNLGAAVRLSQLPCGNIDPLGVTGTPIVDPTSGTLFLDAMTIPTGSSSPTHLVFALSVDDLSTKPGWPLDVAARVQSPVRFVSTVQNQRSALAILNGTLYIAYGAHAGDCGNYHGWVVAVPVSTPNNVIAWSTRASGGGIWGPGGIASDGASLFVATGNTFGVTQWGDGEAIIRLPPSLSFSQQTTDFFRPTDWLNLDQRDLDLGGSGPVLLTVSNSSPSHLIVALGKDGTAYLVDQSNLGGESATAVFSDQVSSSEIINAAAAYKTTQSSYVVFRANGTHCPGGQVGDLVALRISGTPPTFQTAWCASQNGKGSPIVTTTDGQANVIVWGLGAEGDGRLHGFDGDTGQVVFAGGGSSDAMGGISRFQTPIVANGRLFVAGTDRVYAFSP